MPTPFETLKAGAKIVWISLAPAMMLGLVALWLNGIANDFAPDFALQDVRIVEGTVRSFHEARGSVAVTRTRHRRYAPTIRRFVRLQDYPETDFLLPYDGYPMPIPSGAAVRLEMPSWPADGRPIRRVYRVAGLAIDGRTHFTAVQEWSASRTLERRYRGYALTVGGLALFWIAFVLRWRRAVIRQTIEAVRRL
ncbi:hypothetical protein [Nitratireductor sp. ZSWI3]|uniref:hypothetical protein n=1 Tax=Nitratireductor sp. ZSWI3 TaxID=2966359 RepID=UPI0021502BDF|nr:hypothetical protein [Nitratireductor sp. ZSWI3]MCR4266551.1 hypothetical protein [Nitratireductor sp. ZSWI3]